MGAFGSGFLQGFTSSAQKIIDKKHDEDQAKKTELRSGLWQIAYDPKQPEAVRQNAQEQLQKLYGPEGKKGLQKFGEVFSKITRGNQQAQPGGGPLAAPGSNPDDPGAPGQGTPAPAQATGQSRGMTENLPNGQPAPGTAGSKPMGSRTLAPPQFSLPAAPTDAQLQGSQDAAAQAQTRRNIDSEKAELDFWTGKGKDLGLDGRDLAQYAATKGQHLPPQTKRIADKGIARPGEDPASGKSYEGLWDHIVEPDGTETWAKRPESKTGGQIRNITHSVSVQDAKDQRDKMGATFKDNEGKDIDLDKLSPGMGLQAFARGNELIFMPFTPNQKEITVGNVKYAVTPYNVSQAGQQGSTAPPSLGVARTGSTTLKTSLDFDPTGNPVVNTLPSTTTPITTGARPAAQPQGGGSPAPSAPAAQPRKSGPLAPPAGATAPAGGQPQASGNPPGTNIQGVPASVYRDSVAKAVPLMESVTQVFGDPAHPELKSLMGFADLADDPKAKERLGKALKLTFDGLSDATGGANVAVGAGPVTVSAGGFGQWLQNAIGLPANIAAQHAKLMQDAVKDLTPEEREAYDAEMTAFSTAVGLRSLTRASAAQGSVRAIEREIPLIGVNTVSKKQFYDQMQRLAELSINGIRTFPSIGGAPVGFDKGIAARINAMPAELKKLKDATPQRGLGKPGESDNERMEYNGDTYERPKGSKDSVPWKKVKKAA